MEIMNPVEVFKSENPDKKLLGMWEFGSRLFGTNRPDSDTDYKGIYLSSKESLILGIEDEFWKKDTSDSKKKNTAEDIDFEMFSLHKFLYMLGKGDTIAIDLLFAITSPTAEVYVSNEWKELFPEVKKILTRNLHAFYGYCVSQSSKYSLKGERLSNLEILIKDMEPYKKSEVKLKDLLFKLNLEDLEDNKTISFKDYIDNCLKNDLYKYVKIQKLEGREYIYVLGKNYLLTLTGEQLYNHLADMRKRYGKRAEAASENAIDLKSVSHSFRILYECQELMLNGEINFPSKHAAFLKDIRNGCFEPEDLFESLFTLLDKTKIIEESDRNQLKDIPAIEVEKMKLDILKKLYGLTEYTINHNKVQKKKI